MPTKRRKKYALPSQRKIKSFLRSSNLSKLPKALPAIKVKRIYAVPQKVNRWQKSLTKTERTDLRGFLMIIFAIFTFLILTYFVGMKVLSNLPIFLAKTTGTVQKEDKIPPPPPTLFTSNLSTNPGKVLIEGFSEKGSEITLFHNGQEIGKAITAEEGKFVFEVNLLEGKNTFHATAKDPSGNTSNPSANLEITLDKTAPKLQVSKPSDGQTFSEASIEISGTTEPGTSVFINGAYAAVRSDGSFLTSYNLTSGENELKIEGVDKAGNKTAIILHVSYSPPQEPPSPPGQGE